MEPVFECEFTPTVRMIAARIRNYSPVRCIILLLLGIGFFIYGLHVVFWSLFDSYGIAFFLFCVAYLLFGIFMPEVNAYFWVRRFKRDPSAAGVYRIAFGDSIVVRQGNIRINWDYGEINEVFHLKYTYELMKDKHIALMIDPDSFTKGTFPEFKQFLREKRPDLYIPE